MSVRLAHSGPRKVMDRRPSALDVNRMDWLSLKFLDEGNWVQFCYWLRLHHEGTLREAIDSFMKEEERDKAARLTQASS